jgi:hypothetical protein
MSATIIYSIDSGKAPFRVWLWGTSYPMQIRYSTGTYTFDNVECGVYKIVIIDAEDCIYEIPFTYPCPATTTTTEEPIITTTTTEIITTTTTEALEEYPCNYPINYYGYEYEEIIQINLGAATGAVLFDFNFFYIPVKVIVEFDGTEVINTGYRGNVVNQAMLDAALIALDEPTETINPVSQGILVFTKTTATAYAIVKIYTPLAGSIASIKLRCPVTLVETWTVEFDDHVCIEEVPVTTTTTEEIVVTTTTEEDQPVTTTTSGEPEVVAITDTRSFGYITNQENDCDLGDYPLEKGCGFYPDSVDRVYFDEDPGVALLDYVEIMSFDSIDAGISIWYNGSMVIAGDKIYRTTSLFDWEHGLVTLIRSEIGANNLYILANIRVKYTGYQISQTLRAIISFNGCYSYVPATTTTTPEPVTTTTTP